MKVQIMTNTKFGNGKKLAELLKDEFSADDEVTVADVKEVSPETVAKDVPDVLILGGAIRVFKSDGKSKKWLKQLDGLLKKSGNKIKYGTGFLTHAMPTDKVQGMANKYLAKIESSSIIEKTYHELLTPRVEGQQGPIFSEDMEKAKTYIQDFIKWMK
jgi:menaquinone-dependent protoporphyrinogen IX oxidase